MKRLALVVAITVVAAGVAVGVPVTASTRVVDGRVDDWLGASSGIGGSTQQSQGELVYQDHLYDDLGPDTGVRARQHGTTGAPAGDYRYPNDEGRFAHNVADLLELRFAVDDTSLWVLARLNALKVPDSTVVAIGLDTAPSSAAADVGPWPHEAGISATGVDAVVTLWGTGGSLARGTGAPEPLDAGAVAVDTADEHNAIEARLPLSSLGIDADAGSPADAVGVWAATGLWGAGAGTWMAAEAQPTDTAPGGGSPLVAARAWNVAFRSEETGSFFDEAQAGALADGGDISEFRGELRVDELRAGVDDPAELTPGRFQAIIVDTGFAIGPGEGVSYDGVPGRFPGLAGRALTQKYSFLGRHQPYGLYVPSTHDGATPGPAALVLHGLGGSHSSYNSFDGFLRDMGEGGGEGSDRPPLYLVTPLARGSSFYADYGEVETLAVLDDVFARVPVDRERLYLTGYSMGGYGVYRLGSLYPDRFAKAAVWAGYSGEFTGSYLTDPVSSLNPNPNGGNANMGKANIGDPVQTMENLRHLPLVLLSGTNDEIVPTSGQAATVIRLDELGYRSRWDVYPGYEHFAFGLVDDWTQVRAWLGDDRRTVRPRDITYRFSDAWTAPGLVEQFGLQHGNAWWLRDLTMRTPTESAFELATADAESFGIAAPRVDVVRPDPSLVAEPTPHVQKAVEWVATDDPRPTANRLRLDLDGVGSLRIATAEAGVTICGLEVDLSTDGPTTIALAGVFSPSARIVSGLGGPVDVSGRGRASEFVIDVLAAYDGTLAVGCPRR